MPRYVCVLVISAAATIAACSSDESTGGSTNYQNPPPGPNIDLGGGGDTKSPVGGGIGSGNRDGGTVELTDDQIEQIENSACTGWATEGEALPAVLQLVVDVSGSMESRAPGSRQSKWAVTREALREAIVGANGNPGLPASTAVGVLYYPNMPGDVPASDSPREVTACVNTNAMIPVDILGPADSAHRERIAESLDDANTGEGTPTHDAFKYAYDNGLAPATFSGNRFMLLITDGQPTYSINCQGSGRTDRPVNEQPIVDEITRVFGAGTRTFVIGSPGSEENVSTGDDARPWLSRAAEEGGTAATGCEHDAPNFCHMDMSQAPDFSAALREGLRQVVGAIAACTYALPAPPAGQELDLGRVNVIAKSGSGGAKLILPDENGECSEGWTFNARKQIVLCEKTCAEVQSDAQARIELLFGCAAGQVPIR